MSDLISKQKILNTLDFADKALDEERTVEKYKELLTECIKVLPSVENKGEDRSQGHWIKTISENGITSAVRCSECGFEDNRYMLFRYCPNCGADMRGET